MRRLRAGLELDQRRDRLAVAAPARQARDRNRIDPATAAEDEQRVDAAAREGAVERVAGLERQLRGLDLVAFQRTHPALHADHDRDRLVDDAHFGDGALLRLDQGAALVAVRLRVGLDLADRGALQRCRAGQDLVQLRGVGAQLLELLLDPDRLEPRQLAQSDVEDVVGLALAEAEALDQRRLRLVGAADDRDHLVGVEEDELAAFEDVDAIGDLAEAMARALLDRLQAKADPLAEQLQEALLRRPAVGADHRQVDRRRALQAGVGEQRVDEVALRHGARLRLEDESHRRLLARLVAYRVDDREQRRLQLQLLGAEGLLARPYLRVGELLDLLEHL